MRRKLGLLSGLLALSAVLVLWAGTASANRELFEGDDDEDAPAIESGAIDFKDISYGTTITECPQAGKIDEQPKPLDRRDKDEAEKKSNGNDRRLNQDYSCMPQDETAIDQNPNVEGNYRRGRERLPPRLGDVGVLLDDRQRRALVRRHHAVPVAAERRQPRRRGRPGDDVRPGRCRLLRPDQLQPHG